MTCCIFITVVDVVFYLSFILPGDVPLRCSNLFYKEAQISQNHNNKQYKFTVHVKQSTIKFVLKIHL